uniref:F-box domain-containing protein n=1 Tax=Aegilops tauschii subsp. strangulata TaxID=200361 RepID=A0A453BUY3_AEGTS
SAPRTIYNSHPLPFSPLRTHHLSLPPRNRPRLATARRPQQRDTDAASWKERRGEEAGGMKTRRGACYSCHEPAAEAPEMHRRKRRRTAMEAAGCAGAAVGDLFEDLPDDLLVSILADVAASARSPADLAGAIMTCKRFRELGQNKVVLAKVSPRCLAVRAKSWSDSAHRFLQRCADAGNLDACYLLGMVTTMGLAQNQRWALAIVS